jgi:hypothetical protein
MRGLLLVLVALLAMGADAPAPVEAAADQLVVEVPGKPPYACPGAQPCVDFVEGAFVVSARGWPSWYRIDAAQPGLAGATPRELGARVRAVVGGILARKAVKKAQVLCPAMSRAPLLVGIESRGAKELGPGRKPTATFVTPAAANASFARALADASLPAEAPLFSDQELAAMSKDELGPGVVRLRRAHTIATAADGKQVEIEVRALAIHGTDSKRVAVVIRTYRGAPRKDRGRAFARAASRDLGRLVPTLGITALLFEAHDACELSTITGIDTLPFQPD